MSQYEKDIEILFDILTNHECTTYEEIAALTPRGDRWSIEKVGDVLRTIRLPEVGEEWGWTVPHVKRGNSNVDRVYHVISYDDEGFLSEEERLDVHDGTISTLRHIASMAESQSHALRQVSKVLPLKLRKKVNNQALIQEAVAVQLRDLLDSMN